MQRGKATADGDAAPKKKARAAPPAEDGADFNIDELKGKTPEQVCLCIVKCLLFFVIFLQLKKETVASLKEICKFLGLPVSGTKPVLIDKILAALAK